MLARRARGGRGNDRTPLQESDTVDVYSQLFAQIILLIFQFLAVAFIELLGLPQAVSSF
jgi:hypothetical protein